MFGAYDDAAPGMTSDYARPDHASVTMYVSATAALYLYTIRFAAHPGTVQGTMTPNIPLKMYTN